MKHIIADRNHWKKVSRKLARWLPINGLTYGVVRPDLPDVERAEFMAPEDWIRIAEGAVR